MSTVAPTPAAPPALAAARVPVAARAVRFRLGGDLAADRAASLVRGDAHPFALVGRWAGASAVVGSEPLRIASPQDDPLALLDELPAVDAAPADFVGGG